MSEDHNNKNRKRTSRRRFLFWGGSGCIAFACLGLATKRYLDSIFSVVDLIDVLKDRLFYLRVNVSDEEFSSFIGEFIERNGPIERDRSDLKHAVLGTKSNNPRLAELEVQFLLSTDFFLNGADESKSVSYQQYYDPYDNPCWNPLFRE